MRRLVDCLMGWIMSTLVLMVPMVLMSSAQAHTVNTRFSCSQVADDGGEKITMADVGEIDIVGDSVRTFRWESAIYRATHGYDCNIDEEDELEAQVRDDAGHPAWRIALKDGRAARLKRGYNFERGVNCTIRLDQEKDTLTVRPSCPALCGSRINFSSIAIDLKTGSCRYE